MRITDGLPKVYRELIQNFPETAKFLCFVETFYRLTLTKMGVQWYFISFTKFSSHSMFVTQESFHSVCKKP